MPKRPAAAWHEKDPLVALCRRLPGVTEDFKWGNDLVFSVGGKMFAVFELDQGVPFSFKAAPLVFAALTEKEGVEPAPYMARHSWVMVGSRRTLPREMAAQLLEDSYHLVAERLPRKLRRQLGLEEGG